MKISFKLRAKCITMHCLYISIPDNASFPFDPRATNVFACVELNDADEVHPYRLIEVLAKMTQRGVLEYESRRRADRPWGLGQRSGWGGRRGMEWS